MNIFFNQGTDYYVRIAHQLTPARTQLSKLHLTRSEIVAIESD